ncbi:hypothetical protein [Paracoccus marcusii]
MSPATNDPGTAIDVTG